MYKRQVFTVDKDQKVQDAFVSQVQQLEKNKKVIDDEEIQHKITDYQLSLIHILQAAGKLSIYTII